MSSPSTGLPVAQPARRKLLPHEVAFLLNAATQQRSAGDLESAASTLHRILAHEPGNGSALCQLSILASAQGKHRDAEEFGRRAVELSPGRAEFHFVLGRALKSQERYPEAIEAYRASLRIHDRAPEVLVSLGLAQARSGRLDDALASYRKALRIDPDYPEALINLGNALAIRRVYEANGQVLADELREAERVQRRAVDLAPMNSDAQHNLGMTLKFMLHYDEACEVFNRALALAPGRVDTCLQFGDLLYKIDHLAEARQLYEAWLARNPPDVDVMSALALTLIGLGETEIARQWLTQVVTIDPKSAPAHHMLGQVLQQTVLNSFDAREALQAYARAIAARPDYYEAHCAYLLTTSYVEEDPGVIFRAHAAFGQKFGRPQDVISQSTRQRPHDRLRVGYLSYDFKRHSVMYFLEGLMREHDRSRFEVFCYKNNHGTDDVTRRIQGFSEHWIESSRMTDSELAERIAADEIDVLIDLSGLTAGTRLPVLRRRPAPCQITYLGYPTSTGAPIFDFRVTDWVIDPDGSEGLNTEKLLRCTSSMFCYQPDESPEIGQAPLARNGYLTFGSFNNLAKVSPKTLELWARILQGVPNSRLRLKARSLSQPGNRVALEHYFSNAGVDPGRVMLEHWQPDLQSHLGVYREVDVAVDTFPYNGATTTCEALWMGVPVVSMTGNTHTSRMGRSILEAAGQPGWASPTIEGCVELAQRWADRPDDLNAWRSSARMQLQSSLLMDRVRFTKGFERLLEEALAAVSDTSGIPG